MTSLLLLALVAAAPSDAAAKYGLKPDLVQQTAVGAAFGQFTFPAWALKGVPASGRVAAVEALGAFAKAYTGTDEFKKAYASRRAEVLQNHASSKPTPPAPKQTYEAFVAAQRAEYAGKVADMEKVVATMPAAQQPQMRKMLADQRAANEKFLGDRKTIEAMLNATADGAQAEYQRHLEAWTKDEATLPNERPEAGLKASLEHLLAVTADVDFGAKVQNARFVKADYENKPAEWKYCFRAGKDATAAARRFAQAWAAELK
jgi:hypothetical protein